MEKLRPGDRVEVRLRLTGELLTALPGLDGLAWVLITGRGPMLVPLKALVPLGSEGTP